MPVATVVVFASTVTDLSAFIVSFASPSSCSADGSSPLEPAEQPATPPPVTTQASTAVTAVSFFPTSPPCS
ncbi:hypothetical protein [Streptomyces sp. NPDC050287]|uniref:hypothetical protein n=1 Tax=Streptomyces sp. NPDC050287 TaxID=3365608 RepID=UPI0037B74FA4